MDQISASLRQRYAAIQAQATTSINRHRQADMAAELAQLSELVQGDKLRDNYGVGGIAAEFEQSLAELFGQPSCVFLPTGTLAQCVAMKCYSDASNKLDIGLHPTSHLLLHEHNAIESLWGLQAVIMGDSARVQSVNDLSALTPETTAAIIVELPMREIGGALPSWEALVQIRHWCNAHNVKLHMDGARVWQVQHYYQRSLAQIAQLFDSIYVSFYKDLGGIIGAALLGETAFIKQARIWARRAGGNPITQYPNIVAAQVGLNTYLPKMPEYVAYTQSLCAQLNALPNAQPNTQQLSIVPASPKAAMFHLHINIAPEKLAQQVVDYAEKTGIIVLPLPRAGDEHSSICEITVGDNALNESPEFWATHLARCLVGLKHNIN